MISILPFSNQHYPFRGYTSPPVTYMSESFLHFNVLLLAPGSVALVLAGGYHTCALLNVGGVICWGGNGYGQLGVGDTNDRNSPTGVTGLGAGECG
jgi:alpha-tubulin suppressor-like RCC1 family protein